MLVRSVAAGDRIERRQTMHSASHKVWIALGTLAACLALAGTAYGQSRPDDRAGARGIGPVSQVSVPDVFERAVARHAVIAAAVARPDDRAGVRGIGAPTSATSASSSSSVPWLTVGLVLVAAAGLLLLAARAATHAMRHRTAQS
jgi:hypothetical protein